MYYAFDFNDTKALDEFNMSNIDIVSIVRFETLEKLENFLDVNYSYIPIYNSSEKYPTPVDFKNIKEAKIELIRCLNK